MTHVYSAHALQGTKQWEEYVAYPYDDKVPPRRVNGKRAYVEWTGGPVRGTITIGYGHTDAAGPAAPGKPKIVPGMYLTEPEAAELLARDMAPCGRAVDEDVKVPLTQGQYDCLDDFTFNCGRGNLRHLLQQLDVFSAPAEFVVAHQRPEGSAAEYSELLFIDLLEEGALIEIQRALQIPEKIPLGNIQQLDLEHVAGFALVHQVPDSAPSGLQLLEGGIMQNLVQLQRHQPVNLGDAR